MAILGAMSIRAAGVLPTADLTLSFIGVFGWTLVGLLWKDRAIIVLNAAGLTILAIGLLKVIFHKNSELGLSNQFFLRSFVLIDAVYSSLTAKRTVLFVRAYWHSKRWQLWSFNTFNEQTFVQNFYEFFFDKI